MTTVQENRSQSRIMYLCSAAMILRASRVSGVAGAVEARELNPPVASSAVLQPAVWRETPRVEAPRYSGQRLRAIGTLAYFTPKIC